MLKTRKSYKQEIVRLNSEIERLEAMIEHERKLLGDVTLNGVKARVELEEVKKTNKVLKKENEALIKENKTQKSQIMGLNLEIQGLKEHVAILTSERRSETAREQKNKQTWLKGYYGEEN